jgi:excisionase family DNA binding protein
MPEATVDRRRRALDVEGLMERLNVNEPWVRRAVAEKRIPYYKVGRLLRFDADEIERWLGRNSVSPEA